LRLDAASCENTLVFSEQKIKLLERHSPSFADAVWRPLAPANCSTRTP
jgi:hypothetical protein